MSRVTCDLTISLDGFLAGPNQSLAEPLGEGGELLHRWQFEEAESNAAAREGILAAGAFIMGRNMFAGPGPGAWAEEWRGWWGAEPPYHAPVFVLTHHPRDPLVMEGGTTFNFVADGIESALAQARKAAGSKDIAIAGGAQTARQYLSAGLIDELRLHIAPMVLGAGERLLDGVANLKLEPTEVSGTSLVTHIRYRVTGSEQPGSGGRAS
ncbi:dihydrofolate reductase family protein [Arthrobacter sp. B10-11]|uniref:dihydrofolate reductase family protein n=1 Tax=Arthrobacter sp. B10-11 TaxID=3081160 RepID=UPI0029548D6F|nr:dihydrofolate reductase family protein [Arthrobacter sp. B10-11]MDV8148714.1 dihydrofolate reductase family protein [Arthrobacter sp. B10-11]